jgi:hypothetical protein
MERKSPATWFGAATVMGALALIPFSLGLSEISGVRPFRPWPNVWFFLGIGMAVVAILAALWGFVLLLRHPRLVIEGGNDEQSRQDEYRQPPKTLRELPPVPAHPLIECKTTVLIVTNSSRHVGARRCRVQVESIDPRPPGTTFPLYLEWLATDERWMDLPPKRSGHVVLFRSWQREAGGTFADGPLSRWRWAQNDRTFTIVVTAHDETGQVEAKARFRVTAPLGWEWADVESVAEPV